MKFEQHRWIGYDAVLIRDHTQLHEIIAVAADLTRQRPALSGMEDVIESLQIAHECATHQYASYQFKELQREETGAEIDHLYNEPVSATRVHVRTIPLHGAAVYADPEIKLEKTGWDFTQPVRIGLSVVELRTQDYYPEPGDEVVFIGRPYQIIKVYLAADSFFAQTGIPLWVTVEAAILRHGDSAPPKRLSDLKSDPTAAPIMQRLKRFQQVSSNAPI